MWHEARKQERKIRGMLVDYRKRAERRRDFYEKIKADPTQFLQVHGRQSKISLDPAIAAAADSATTMVPWQGHQDNLIDRFDVRAHLDFIPAIQKLDDEEPSLEDRQLNYERYRIVAQNSFLQIGEEKFLRQLHLEEQFGYTEQHEPKKKKTGGVAIGFNYEDGTGTSQPAPVIQHENNEDSENSEGSDSDLDVDLSINVSKVDSAEAHEMNRHGRNFGMSTNDFYSFLTDDLEEAENFRLAKEEENEKALFAGRKSRRERRAHREKRLANRKISPPSYAAQVSPSANAREESKSPTRSPSPEVSEKITYITSFGGDDEPQMPLNPTYADKVKFGNKFNKLRRDSEERVIFFEKKTPGCSNRHGTRRRSVSSRRRSRSHDRDRSRRTYHQRSSNNHRKSRSSSGSSSSRSNSRTRSTRQRRHRRRNGSSLSKSSKSSDGSTSSKGGGGRRRRSSSKSNIRGGDGNAVGVGATHVLIKSETENDLVTDTQLKQEEVGPTQKAIPRYYGRRRSDHSSSSELGVSDENDDIKMEVDDNPVTSPATQRNMSSGNASTTAQTGSSGVGLSVQERLKRKRQALLNKQFKADKIAEQLKTEREKLEQQTREDELREMGIKLRRKQRERRHAYESDNSTSSTRSSSRSSKSPTTTNNSNPTSQTDLPLNTRDKSRSKSPSSRHSSNHKDRDRDDSKSRRSSSRSRSSHNKSRDHIKYRDTERDKRSKSANRKSRDKDRSRRSRSRDRDSVRSRDRDRLDGDTRGGRSDRNDWSRDRSSRTRRMSRSRSHSRSRRDAGRSRRDDRDRDFGSGGRGNGRSLVDY